MLLQPIRGFGAITQLYPVQKSNLKQQQNNYGLSSYNNIVFMGSTSAGRPFRKLKDIPDAYFGGITIENGDLERAVQNSEKLCQLCKETPEDLKAYSEVHRVIELLNQT